MHRRVTMVWIALMAATVATTWLLSKDAFTPRVCTVGTLVIASWKVRLILLDFMELRVAPLAGRLVFEAWSLGAPAMILAYYLAT